MADTIDQGVETADLFLQAALSTRVTYSGISASHCEECDAEIPLKRQQTIRGCRLCVDCASVQEIKNKRIKRPQGITYDKFSFSG